MGCNIHSARRVLYATSLGSLFLSATGAFAASPCATPTAQVVGGLKVIECLSDKNDLGNSEDDSNYYGWVEVDSGSIVGSPLDKDISKKIMGILFNYKEVTTSVVSISVSQNLGGESTVIYEKPIFLLERNSGDKIEVKASTLSGVKSRVTPYFSLGSGNPELTVRMKVTRARAMNGKDLLDVGKGVDPTASLGNSLISGIGELPYAVIVNRLYAGMLQAFANTSEATSDVKLQFDRTGGYKSAGFSIDFDKSGANRATAALRLRVRPSLITDQVDAAGKLDLSGIKDRRFAELISIFDAQSRKPIPLSKYIDDGNIPRKLIEFETSASSETPTARDVVNRACNDLKKALSSSPVRLSTHDLRLVMFSELLQAGVFKRFAPNELSCTSDMASFWASSYVGLPAISTANAIYRPSTATKNGRLLRLTTALKANDASNRAELLAESLAAKDTPVLAPSTLLPFAGSTPEDDGRIRMNLSGASLATLQATCFGNFKPTNPENLAEATAFAKFTGPDESYLVRVAFDTTQPFDQRFGPRIASLDIKVASDEDKLKLNQKKPEEERCF